METLAVVYAHCNLVTQCMKYGDVIIAGALVIDITAGKYFFMNLLSRWKPISSVFFFFAFLYFLYKSNRLQKSTTFLVSMMPGLDPFDKCKKILELDGYEVGLQEIRKARKSRTT